MEVVRFPVPKNDLGGSQVEVQNCQHAEIRRDDKVWRRSISWVPKGVWWITGTFVLLGIVVWLFLWIITTPKNPMTVQQVKQLIQRECPIGSSRSQVLTFMDKYCTHEFDPRDKEVGCRIENTARSLGVVSDIAITFYSDDSDRLVRYEAEEQLTGW